jgi:DNA invertase Pin-like site-specific DNA recombinase
MTGAQVLGRNAMTHEGSRRGRPNLTPDQRSLIVKLDREHVRAVEIAERLLIDVSTVWRVLRISRGQKP